MSFFNFTDEQGQQVDADAKYAEVRLAVLERLHEAVKLADSHAALSWANVYKLIEDAGYCTDCDT